MDGGDQTADSRNRGGKIVPHAPLRADRVLRPSRPTKAKLAGSLEARTAVHGTIFRGPPPLKRSRAPRRAQTVCRARVSPSQCGVGIPGRRARGPAAGAAWVSTSRWCLLTSVTSCIHQHSPLPPVAAYHPTRALRYKLPTVQALTGALRRRFSCTPS